MDTLFISPDGKEKFIIPLPMITWLCPLVILKLPLHFFMLLKCFFVPLTCLMALKLSYQLNVMDVNIRYHFPIDGIYP